MHTWAPPMPCRRCVAVATPARWAGPSRPRPPASATPEWGLCQRSGAATSTRPSFSGGGSTHRPGPGTSAPAGRGRRLRGHAHVCPGRPPALHGRRVASGVVGRGVAAGSCAQVGFRRNPPPALLHCAGGTHSALLLMCAHMGSLRGSRPRARCASIRPSRPRVAQRRMYSASVDRIVAEPRLLEQLFDK